MLEIKTIIGCTAELFDDAVNQTIREGWELVRRECFITGSDRAKTFYAELERVVDDPEEEEDDIADTAHWELSRNPHTPYRCSACGYTTNAPWPVCHHCDRIMRDEE